MNTTAITRCSIDNTVQGGSYEVVNMPGTFVLPWSEHTTLDLAVTNLLNEQYAFFFPNLSTYSAVQYATPGPPRQIRATLRVSFPIAVLGAGADRENQSKTMV